MVGKMYAINLNNGDKVWEFDTLGVLFVGLVIPSDWLKWGDLFWFSRSKSLCFRR